MMFTDYLLEREALDTIVTDRGFIAHKMLPDGNCFIGALYVAPASRGTSTAQDLVGMVERIARKRGARKLLGTVDLSDPGADRTRSFTRKIGMELAGVVVSSMEVFVKELE